MYLILSKQTDFIVFCGSLFLLIVTEDIFWEIPFLALFQKNNRRNFPLSDLIVLSVFLVSWNISEEIGDSNQVRNCHVISEWVTGSPGASLVLKTAPSFIAYWLSGFAYRLHALWMKYLLLLNAYQLSRRVRLRE